VCRYSHDKGIEVFHKGETKVEPKRKGEKRAVYEGEGDDVDEETGERGGMAGWTQEQLEEAVAKREADDVASGRKKPNATKIICKHFLAAVENRSYGWFWSCPDDDRAKGQIGAAGEGCKYRHVLPQGYVLKSEMQAMLAAAAAGTKEAAARDLDEAADRAEKDRRAAAGGSKLTAEVFEKWRSERSAARVEEIMKKRRERIAAGRLTGRELFDDASFAAQMAEDDAGNDGDDDWLKREVDPDEEERVAAEAAAAANAAANRERAAYGGGVGGSGNGGGEGDSPATAGGASPGAVAAAAAVDIATLGLGAAEADALFGDSDDDGG